MPQNIGPHDRKKKAGIYDLAEKDYKAKKLKGTLIIRGAENTLKIPSDQWLAKFEPNVDLSVEALKSGDKAEVSMHGTTKYVSPQNQGGKLEAISLGYIALNL